METELRRGESHVETQAETGGVLAQVNNQSHEKAFTLNFRHAEKRKAISCYQFVVIDFGSPGRANGVFEGFHLPHVSSGKTRAENKASSRLARW